MIAQLVIAFYFIVCVGIIVFNCFTEIISRYRSCVLKRREQRYCEEYRQLFLENITENKKQEKRLVKELHSTSRLLTFSEALYKVENSMPEQFQQGIASVSRLMEELIPVYERKSDMEKACLAYVFAIFHMLSMSGTVKASVETSKKPASVLVRSALGVRLPVSYCAIRTSAERSGNPTT